MTINKLREAMGRDPCKEHAEECPIPKKGRRRRCQWGHTAFEFADQCDKCAKKVLSALKGPGIAQRVHHEKRRSV